MESLDNYIFGNVYTDKIPAEEASKFAKVFGEGSPNLTRLLEYCMVNDISTLACCKGHPIGGYISFPFTENDKNMDYAYFIASIPLLAKDIESNIDYTKQGGRAVSLYLHNDSEEKKEKQFAFIYKTIKKYKELKDAGMIITPVPDIKKMVDYIFEKPILTNFVIKKDEYIKSERNENYDCFETSCPAWKKTNKFHKMFYETLKHKKEVDNFIKKNNSL